MSARPEKRSLRWPLAAAGALALAVAAATLTRPPPPLSIDVVQVQRGEVRELIPAAAAGEVRAARRVTSRAELAGTVAEVRKRAGERVTAGEVLVRFTSDELDARLTQARANQDAADVAVATARMRHQTAERNLARTRQLRSGEAISAVELERAETELEVARHAMLQAEAGRKQAAAALRLAQVAADRALVRAPFAGVLQEVFAEVGVLLAPGAPLFDLLDDSAVRVVVPFDESDAARLELGQTVTLRTGAGRDAQLTGTLSFIPPAVGRGGAGLPGAEGAAPIAGRERALYVEVTPPEGSGAALRVGASVHAELLVRAMADVLYVPTHVVLGRGKRRSVYRVEGGVARQVFFEAGLTSWERTEVLSGLAAGDRVIASLNVKGLADGARVAIARGEGEPAPPAAEAR
jgi:HlyD family secretion protein